MPSGTTTPAIGPYTPGPSHPSASATPAIPPRSPRLAAPISNRHLVQLEIAASLAESTASLFLIDPKQHLFHHASGIACRAGCVFLTRLTRPKPVASTRTPRISNRHLVQLEFTLTPTESTTSLFLIVTNSPYFSHPSPVSPLFTPQVTFPGTFSAAPAYLSATGQKPSGGF